MTASRYDQDEDENKDKYCLETLLDVKIDVCHMYEHSTHDLFNEFAGSRGAWQCTSCVFACFPPELLFDLLKIAKTQIKIYTIVSTHQSRSLPRPCDKKLSKVKDNLHST